MRVASLSRGIAFVTSQKHDWKVTVVRTSLDRLAYQIVYPYLSIFVLALGASATQLGLAISVGMVLGGLIGPFAGWFMDRTGPKAIYLLGIGLLAASYLTYGFAPTWIVALAGMVIYWLGYSFTMHSCSTVCGNCLANQDRATGMTICETVAAGILGMAGPIVGAELVSRMGGINPAGIRPLFFVAFAVTLGTFAVVLTQLSTRRWTTVGRGAPHVLRELQEVLSQGRYLKRWLVIASVGALPVGMVFPFSQAFAHGIKGANEFVLAAMVAGSALASIAFAVPFGRLADKIGRKRVLYVTMPMFWLSSLVLVCAPHPAFLIVAGVLQGFYYILGPISAAMERELVPVEQMGRWLGIARLFRMLVGACLTSVAGLIWDQAGPQYVFLVYVAIDMSVRMPLLITMPETLGIRFRPSVLAASKSQAS